MFNIDSSEFILVAVIALVVIGPKDLPKALRVIGYWVGKARGVARQFRSGFDTMIREAELEEMEKRWAGENERIMREHPPTADDVGSASGGAEKRFSEGTTPDAGSVGSPVHVEQPHIVAAADTVDKSPDGEARS